jgi:hypothetical protein
MQLQFLKETGKYLDIKTWTICSGSRLPGGLVAYGSWSPDDRRVYFLYFDPGYEFDNYGARLAISLNPSSLNPSELEMRVKALEEEVKMIRKHLTI